MKNYIFKTLLTLILSTFTLPMLSQDFMNIYFKDGSFRIIIVVIFYLWEKSI